MNPWCSPQTHLMELAGIEPASENLSITASSIIVHDLKFPKDSVHEQTQSVGSFIYLLLSQSFDSKVPRKDDAVSLNSGWSKGDSCN